MYDKSVCDKLQLAGHLPALCEARADYRAKLVELALERGEITLEQLNGTSPPPAKRVICLYLGAPTGQTVECLEPG